MTQQEINTAIAESIGWHNIQCNPINPSQLAGTKLNQPVSDLGNPLLGIPNYECSLDAIVPVVRAMDIHSQDEFAKELYKATPDTLAILATPAQWCEAYLKSRNLWK
jgi:hypothetical protein